MIFLSIDPQFGTFLSGTRRAKIPFLVAQSVTFWRF